MKRQGCGLLFLLNQVYEAFRWLRYGRVLDVETFRVYIDRGGEFIFENIYSNGHGLYEDDIHGDPPIAPRRVIKHFFANAMHPVVFVNTSNHAMAEFDANHCLWKWEYIPGTMGCPVKLGKKSREEIERSFSPLFMFWRVHLAKFPHRLWPGLICHTIGEIVYPPLSGDKEQK